MPPEPKGMDSAREENTIRLCKPEAWKSLFPAVKYTSEHLPRSGRDERDRIMRCCTRTEEYDLATMS